MLKTEFNSVPVGKLEGTDTNPVRFRSAYQAFGTESLCSSWDTKVHTSGKCFHSCTHLVFRSSASAEESFRRFKLLNEPEEMFRASPHGERHLGMWRHATVALKGQTGQLHVSHWLENDDFRPRITKASFLMQVMRQSVTLCLICATYHKLWTTVNILGTLSRQNDHED